MNKTTTITAMAIAAFAATQGAQADITTGWLPTAQGTYSFLDAANWANGETNGVFSADWTPAGWQVFNLSEDWTGSLSFYGNVAKDLTFKGIGGTRTIHLNDDFVIRPSASIGKIVFDTTVNLDLGGGERVFSLASPSSFDKFRFQGKILNGDAVLEGNGGMMLLNNASFSGNVTIRENSTLDVNYANDYHDVTRAGDVTLHRGILSVKAYNGDDTSRFGVLSANGGDAAAVSIVALSDNGRNHVSTLSAEKLSVEDGGTLAVMGANLGADAAVSTHFILAEPPSLVGNASGAGTPTVAVVPGVVTVGSATLNNIVGYNNGFAPATYDATLGIRPLSATETATAVSPDADVNLVVDSGSPLAIDGDVSVNSLQIRSTVYTGTVPEISGEGTLSVRSGMVLATPVKEGARISVALDFGSETGRMIAGGPVQYGVALSKPVSGTGGLVLSKALVPSWDTTVTAWTGARGFVISSTADYTGDTYVQCIVEAGSSDFLPHGARSGNTIVNGSLNFGTIAINGLRGTGAVRGTTLTVGEDGSDSDFDGSAYLTSALNVAGGAFRLDGSVTQGAVNVAAGAAIGGNGSIATTLTFASGAKFKAVANANGVSCLNVTGAITGTQVAVDADVSGGQWQEPLCVLRSETAIAAGTFVKGDGVVSVEVRENDGRYELWATPRSSKVTRTVVLFQ